MGKFKRIVQEKYESENQSDLYSRHAEELVEFVKNKLSQRSLSKEDKQRIIDLMEAYGKRMYFRGKQESEKSMPFSEGVIYDVKQDKDVL